MADRRPPPPASSPKLELASEHDSGDVITGVYPASRDFVREVNKSGIFKVAIGVGGFALMCLLAGVTVARAMAQEARDAGTTAAADVKRQADQQGEELKRLQLDFTAHVQVEAEHRVRVEKKLNALLDAQGVKDPAPTPKDGGK